MYEILYADDLVLISENIHDLKEKFYKWKEAFETKGLKVNLRKTKVMMSGIEGKITKSKIDPCGVCGKRVMSNSVLCKKCNSWIHERCAKVNRVTINLASNFECSRCTNCSVVEEHVEQL